MKKLLSLLSVLTISGTTMPTTIAASPYQNQEKLNRNKRNNIFNTYFRNGFSGKISKITEIPYFVKSLGIVEKSGSYKENKGFIKIRKKIPLIYWTK